MDFQQVFCSSTAVQFVNVLRDDGNFSALFAKTFLTLCYGLVGRVGVLGKHNFPTVVVELPNTGGIVGEGRRSGQFLKFGQKKQQRSFLNGLRLRPNTIKRLS